MDNLFQKKEESFTFFDGDGNKVERKTEIRFDPLTQETSRVVFDPGMEFVAPDYTKAAEQTSGKNCPFCPENINKMTPLFPKEIAEEGRVTHGDATVFPNLFPYSKHNGVVVLSKDHYLRLNELDVPLITNALIASQKYIESALKTEDKPLFTTINWNYLPLSGGSIIHPHMHIVLSEEPLYYQGLSIEKANQFKEKHKQCYYSTLYKTEKELDERWIGEYGQVAWMHAYAPKSHNDFLGIFTKATTIQDITEQDWTDFAKGLQAIFPTLSEQGFGSFNMALTFSNEGTPAHVRLIPRLTLGGLGTSDMNFFHTLHGEPLSYKAPEDIAKLTKRHFN